MYPLSLHQFVLKVGTRSLAAHGIEDVRRDAVRTACSQTVKTKRPLVLSGAPLAEPVHVWVGRLSRESKNVGPHPHFDGQAGPARGLTERRVGTDLDIIAEVGPVESHGRVRVVRDRARLSERWCADIRPDKTIGGFIGGGRSVGLAESPVRNRAFREYSIVVRGTHDLSPREAFGAPGEGSRRDASQSCGRCKLQRFPTCELRHWYPPERWPFLELRTIHSPTSEVLSIRR